jgi:hypothetical protein
MIDTFQFQPGTGVCPRVPEDEIDRLVVDPGQMLWIDVTALPVRADSLSACHARAHLPATIGPCPSRISPPGDGLQQIVADGLAEGITSR